MVPFHPRAGLERPFGSTWNRGSSPEEVFVDFPVHRDQVPPCTHVRSTLIGSSILALRKHGLFDRYAANLPPEHRNEILYAVAGYWLPIGLGCVHYAACEALALSPADAVAIGASVAAIAQKTMFSFVLRLAVDGGVTPWTMLANGAAHWGRSYRGSGVAAYTLGPKDCRVEAVGNPLAAIPYWRSALRGILTALTQAFSTRAYVHELARSEGEPLAVSYRLSWA